MRIILTIILFFVANVYAQQSSISAEEQLRPKCSSDYLSRLKETCPKVYKFIRNWSDDVTDKIPNSDKDVLISSKEKFLNPIVSHGKY